MEEELRHHSELGYKVCRLYLDLELGPFAVFEARRLILARLVLSETSLVTQGVSCPPMVENDEC